MMERGSCNDLLLDNSTAIRSDGLGMAQGATDLQDYVMRERETREALKVRVHELGGLRGYVRCTCMHEGRDSCGCLLSIDRDITFRD